MKKTASLTATLLATVLLASCTGTRDTSPDQPRNAVNLHHHLQNPLFVERYGEEMLEQITAFEMNDDEIFNDEKKAAFIEELRSIWRSRIEEASQVQRKNPRGRWIPMEAFAKGEVMLMSGAVHLGPETEIAPSSHMHLYVSEVLDPRDQEFPDPTAIDLGTMHNFYGPQTYAMDPVEDLLAYRTAVLYDEALEKIYTFVQLNLAVPR